MKIVTELRPYLVHITMKKLEESLPADKIVRTHKSYLIAVKRIKALRTYELQIGENLAIPLSINHRDEVMKLFSKEI